MLSAALTLAMMQVPPADRGSVLYAKCRVAVRLMDERNPSGLDLQDANYCIGYIDGFSDALESREDHTICTEGATLGTLARVYVAYMVAHPKAMDQDRSLGLINALQGSYDCTKK